MHRGIEPSGGKEISIMDVVIKVIATSNHFRFRFSFLYLGSVKNGYFCLLPLVSMQSPINYSCL